MTESVSEIQEKILMQALPQAAQRGWIQSVLTLATEDAGYEREMAVAVFPEGIADLAAYFSDWTDQKMLDALQDIDAEDLKIRARVAKGVMARFRALEPHRDALKQAAKFWAVPHRSFRAKQLIWSTADHIWNWAGDTATDYNRYTKRGLLSGVIGATTLYWLSQNESDLAKVETFLKARIENVLKIGQSISKFKDMGDMVAKFPFKSFFDSRNGEPQK
tara:strand:+ start:690 stop:1346 length:657 start_codon:yes stop_codon:yes gene_type:complete